jgi:1-acyl-sn-glycerol-3-phosphate acyltransferase
MRPYFLSPLILQKIIWIPTRLFLKFFGHLDISGLENLRGLKTNVIFACNHTSEMDPFFVPASLGFFSRFSPIFYTSREKAFYANSGWRQMFYGGLFFEAWGSYAVFPGNQDYELGLINHIAIVNDGGNVVIYPEGGTTKDGLLRPAKGGVAYLAERTGRPIVPVSVSGLFKLYPKDLFMRRKHFAIHFDKPVYAKELLAGGKDYKDAAQIVMDTIGENLKVKQSPTPVTDIISDYADQRIPT